MLGCSCLFIHFSLPPLILFHMQNQRNAISATTQHTKRKRNTDNRSEETWNHTYSSIKHTASALTMTGRRASLLTCDLWRRWVLVVVCLLFSLHSSETPAVEITKSLHLRHQFHGIYTYIHIHNTYEYIKRIILQRLSSFYDHSIQQGRILRDHM